MGVFTSKIHYPNQWDKMQQQQMHPVLPVLMEVEEMLDRWLEWALSFQLYRIPEWSDDAMAS